MREEEGWLNVPHLRRHCVQLVVLYRHSSVDTIALEWHFADLEVLSLQQVVLLTVQAIYLLQNVRQLSIVDILGGEVGTQGLLVLLFKDLP